MDHRDDTITAIATGTGGAIAVIRLSGPDAVGICSGVFRPVSGEPLAQAKGYTLHYGEITDGGRVIDDVIVSVFRAPRSYTGEDMVEVSCHGSRYIQQEIIRLFIHGGARAAEPGEFTIRAFLNGKIDLSQAEAVADMIAAADKATHAMASNQMRGGYSAEFSALREELLTLVSLLELELDFGEEEVEFADRARLLGIITEVESKVASLTASFSTGSVLKEGMGVAITGSPNVGKSTLLNALLKDDRAMVSDIAGTTRDIIEESLVIDGIRFRFIDTAGIRDTDDTLEKMGIERTKSSIGKANIVLYMAEMAGTPDKTFEHIINEIPGLGLHEGQKLFIVINKIDKARDKDIYWDRNALETSLKAFTPGIRIDAVIGISAKHNININELSSVLASCVDSDALYNGETIVYNSRHYEALTRASESLSRARQGLSDNITTDLLTQDIREVLYHLNTITGEITTDDILISIFSNFCIGK